MIDPTDAFHQRIDQMPVLLKRLRDVPKIPLWPRKGLPKKPVIYLISEENKHLYIGRTKNFWQRMGNHTSGSHHQSTFAFKLAREQMGTVKASYRKEGSRASLAADENFAKAFVKTTDRVRKMRVQFIEIEDDITQHLFEVYCAVALKTPYNEFRTS